MGDGTRLNRTAYVELVDGNLAWLDRQSACLERDHIRTTIVWSVAGLYDDPGPGDHAWAKSHGPHAERCTRCLMTRTISAGAMWEYFDALGHWAVFASPECFPPKRHSGRGSTVESGSSERRGGSQGGGA